MVWIQIVCRLLGDDDVVFVRKAFYVESIMIYQLYHEFLCTFVFCGYYYCELSLMFFSCTRMQFMYNIFLGHFIGN